MPETKAKSARKPTTIAVKNGLPNTDKFGDVLTLNEAALYLRIREEDVLQMVRMQDLAARQIGEEWRFSKSALQNWLAHLPEKSNKQALLQLVGKFKDDPFLEEITREAYRRRRQPNTELGE